MTDQPDPKDIITAARHPLAAPAKPITLTLEYYTNVYKVSGITNSTYYKPGDWLSPDVVQKCCDTPNWTVTIADNEIVQSLLNFGINKVTNIIP